VTISLSRLRLLLGLASDLGLFGAGGLETLVVCKSATKVSFTSLAWQLCYTPFLDVGNDVDPGIFIVVIDDR